MAAVFHHTNIVSHDPERLAQFYIAVFDCVRDGPDRNLQGDWIARGTGLTGAHITGVMLRLPGHGNPGPRLEIFKVAGADVTISGTVDPGPRQPEYLQPRQVTRPGLMHLCFEVDDAHRMLDRILAAGGSRQGDIVDSGTVPGVGRADFVYARDPDGNIVELIAWNR